MRIHSRKTGPGVLWGHGVQVPTSHISTDVPYADLVLYISGAPSSDDVSEGPGFESYGLRVHNVARRAGEDRNH